MALDTIAQAESTRSFFLAQTLESTKTIPVVSAKLPIDANAIDGTDVPAGDGVPSSGGEGSGDSDGASGSDDPVDPSFTLGSSEGDSAAVAAESTVVGSFEYRGITYAVEPGGESVAVVAADYAKLPQDFIDAQTIVLPSVVSPDGVDYYSVTRIADDAFSSLTAAAAADNGESAGADSDIQAQAEACAYEDQATSEPAEGDGGSTDVISSGASEAGGVEKSRPSSESEAESVGITAITIPASITTIEEDAFTGADTLQYVIVSEDNPNYSMYDGCLYDKPLSSLLLIPEGRLGAVRVAPSATSMDPEVFSHCTVDTVVADPGSAAYQLLSENGEEYKNINDSKIEIVLSDDANWDSDWNVDKDVIMKQLDQLSKSTEDPSSVQSISSRSAYGYFYTSYTSFTLHSRPNERRFEIYRGGTGGDSGRGVDALTGGSWGSAIAFNGRGEYPMSSEWIRPGDAGDPSRYGSFRWYNESATNWRRITTGHSQKNFYISVSASANRGEAYIKPPGEHDDGRLLGPGPHIWIDLYLNITWDPQQGSWTEGATTYSYANPKNIDTTITPDGNSSYSGFAHPTSVKSDDPKKVFYGWNESSSATVDSTEGWWYTADGRYNVTETNKPLTLYAIYQDAFPMTWDVERYGSARASAESLTPDVVEGNENAIEAVAGTAKNQHEYVVIDDVTNRTGTMVFPDATHPGNEAGSVRLLGWTNQEDGSKPVDDNGNTHDYFAVGSRYIVSEEGLTGYSDASDSFVIDGKRGNTWYAVWTTDVQFSAPSYGGKIVGDADGITDEVTVFNNQPVPAELIPSMGSDDAGSFVPNQYGEDGYDPSSWTFKGWTTQANPNAPAGGDTPDSSGLGCRSGSFTEADTSQALIPDGATTYYGVWECDVSWAADEDRPSPAEINEKAAADYLYGYRVQAPGVRDTPPSHHFSHWADTAGNQVTAHDGAYVVRTGGPVTAHWAPNTRAVVLNGNDTDVAEPNTAIAQRTYAVYGEDMELFAAKADGSGLDESATLRVPKREGYTFAGYWNTRYTETPGASETVPLTSTNEDGTSKTVTVQARQYYGVDDADDPTALTSLAAWDITNDAQQLFAHWKYTVRLNMNAINSDGEYVLNPAHDDFAADIVWPDAITTEQTECTEGPRYFPTGTVKVEDSTATSANLIAYTFTAVDGAPLQLPQVQNRVGYGITAKWGTTPGTNGEAGGAIYSDVTAPFRTVLSNVTTVTADGLNSQTGHALCLYAAWGGDDERSGKANSHAVTIVSHYGEFQVNEDDMKTVGPVTVTYDEDISLAGTPLASAIPTDASKDANGNPRNLRLAGYYLGKSTVDEASTGRQYLKVNDEGELVSAHKFREDEDITLYAWWTYDAMTISFDPQGGASTKGADYAKTFTGVTANDPVAETLGSYGSLDAAFDTAPKRDGYVFAGWWNTRYTESAADGQIEVLPDGKTVTPRCYYAAAAGTEGERAVSKAPDADRWLEFGDTTLYAHWKYDISFNTNCSPDIADVSVSTLSRSINDEAHINAMALLTPTGAARDGAPTDKFGNVYVETTSADGAAITTVTAIAGAPVLIPEAQNRREKVGNNWERVGYNNTRVWTTGEGTAKVTIELDGTDTAYYRTKTTDSWKDGLPVKLGGWIGGAPATQALTADWTDKEMQFYVQVDYDYSAAMGDTRFSYDSAHATPTMMLRVKYDQSDWRIVTAAGEEGTSVGEGAKLAPEHSADARAKADVTHDGTTVEHANLVFAGIRTEPNPIRSTAVAADAGTEYWARDGSLTTPKFRAIYGANVGGNSFTTPFRFYAVWSEPITPITFNLYDANTTSASTKVEDTVSLMKGDAVVDAAGLDEVESALASVQANEARKNYEFAGFWTTPYAETADANGGVQPICYYVADDADKLVAAAPTTDEWLTSENASDTWLEDSPTSLYAHWKFRVSLENAGTIPGTSTPDMLLFGNDDQGGTFTAAEQAFDLVEVTDAYTDVRNRVTFGAPLWLPLNQNDNGMNKVRRIRDFNAAPDAYGFAGQGRGETGYEFAGWQVNDTSTVLDADALDSATDLLLDPTAVVPGDGGTAHLVATWDALEFTISLDLWPEMYSSFLTDDADLSICDRGTTAVTLAYDDSMRNARPVDGTDETGYIRVPALYGYTYLGYYGLGSDGTTGGKVDASAGTVSDAGKRYFGEPTPLVSTEDPNAAYADDVFWFVKDFDPSTRTSALHAYYTRDEYAVNFHLRDEADGTLQATAGTTPATQWWHYGEKLVADSSTVSSDPHRADGANTVVWPTSTTSTFSRHGYEFGGWYYYKQMPDGLSDADEAAWRNDKRNRVYVYRVDASNMADQEPIPGVYTYDGADFVKQPVTTWRTATDVPMNGEAGVDLYADWTPLEYTVTFVPRFKNNVQHDGVTVKFRYEELIGPDKAKLVKVAETGAPYELVGWATLETTTEDDKLNWLFDKTSYQASVKQDSTDAYPRLKFDGLSADNTARFMPNGLAREFSVYGVWNDLPAKNLVLFRGNHGKLANAAGEANVDASGDFATIAYNYGVPTYLDTLEADWGVTASAEDGYRFLGWVEVSPADIANDTNVTSYGQLSDKSATDAKANAARMAANVNDSDSYQNLVSFPMEFDVKDKSLKYQNPYTSEKLAYRDIYLVAVYQLVDDYRIVLDLGDFATYGDPDYASLGVRLASDANNLFSWQVSKPRIRYMHQFTVVERDAADNLQDVEFLLPEPVSDKHDFAGWYTEPDGKGTRIDDSAPWTFERDGKLWVSACEYAKAVKQGDRETTLYASYTAKTYTVNFQSEQGTEEDIALTGLKLGDTFELPYPATRGEGKYFQNWGLKSASTSALVGKFSAGERFDFRELLNAIRTDGSYKGVNMGTVDSANNTITFRGRWDSAISVTMPVQVLVRVDLEREDVLAAAGDLQANYLSEDNANSLKVVSLRYDCLNAAGTRDNDADDSFVFGGAGEMGKVYLGVYADLQVKEGVEESELFRRANVSDDGTLNEDLVTKQAPPLMIDLARDAVFAENYPSVSADSTAIYEGLYDNGHLYAVTDPDHGLHSHGFRAFGRDGSLPIRYSLLFKNGAKPSDYDLLKGLGAQAADGDAIPIAHLYYTVALAR